MPRLKVVPVQLKINAVEIDGSKLSKALFEQFTHWSLCDYQDGMAWTDCYKNSLYQRTLLQCIEHMVCSHSYISKQAERAALTQSLSNPKVKSKRLSHLQKAEHFLAVSPDREIWDVAVDTDFLYELAERSEEWSAVLDALEAKLPEVPLVYVL